MELPVMGPDVVGGTSLGTGTTKTLLGGANLVLPEWAKSIIAVIPAVNIAVPTVSESVVAKLILESEDFNVGPFEVLAAPITSCIGATIAPFVAKPERYAVNCNVPGGSKLAIYGQALVANTTAPIMSCTILISSEPAPGPQRYAKMGTMTNTGVVASTDVSGTQYSFSKGSKIIELFGTVVPAVTIAADDISGHFRYSSSEFDRVTPAKFEFNPVVGGLSTIFSTKVDGVSRMPVQIPIVKGQVNIQDYVNMTTAPNGTGNFVTGVIVEA